MQSKIILPLLLVLFAFSGLKGQNVFVKLRGGLNVQTAKSVIETWSVTDANGNTSVTPNFATLGGGNTFGLDAGYMFNPNWGISLGFQQLVGSKVNALVNHSSIIEIDAIAYTRQSQVTLGMAVNNGGEKIKLFSDFGLLLPVGGKTTIELDLVSEAFGLNESSVTHNYGKFSVGFYGGLGLEYQFNEMIGLAFETRFSSLRVKSLSGEVVEKTDKLTGEDILANEPTYSLEINYVDELNSNSNNGGINSDFSLDLPKDQLSYSSNYSNLSFQLGLSFYFGK